MTYQHQNLAGGRWFELNFFEQMANIGSEVLRALSWKNELPRPRGGGVSLRASSFAVPSPTTELRGIMPQNKKNDDYSRQAFERALELVDLTIEDRKNRPRLRELTRLRECLVDYFAFDNIYHSTEKSWQDYFLAFSYAARKGRKPRG